TVWTRGNFSDSYFEPVDIDGRECTYTAIILNKETGEELDRRNVTYHTPQNETRFTLPTLENGTDYKIKIIRTTESASLAAFGLVTRTILSENVLAAYAADDVSSEYQVNATMLDIGNFDNLSPGEKLMYEYEFRTSNYNTLADKLAGVNLRATVQNGYQKVEFRGSFEGFDHYDIYGKEDSETKFTASPLVIIEDPFDSPFHNGYSWPLLGGFADTYNDNYYQNGDGITGVYQEHNFNPEIPDFNTPAQTLGPGLDPNGGSNNGINGSIPSNGSTNNNGGQIVRLDVDWPYVGSGYAIDYNWSASYLREPLNEHIESNWLFLNEPDASQPIFGMLQYLSFRYYVTEKVLSDAEGYVDFAEAWYNFVRYSENGVYPPTGEERFYQNDRQDALRESYLQPLVDAMEDIIASPLVEGESPIIAGTFTADMMSNTVTIQNSSSSGNSAGTFSNVSASSSNGGILGLLFGSGGSSSNNTFTASTNNNSISANNSFTATMNTGSGSSNYNAVMAQEDAGLNLGNITAVQQNATFGQASDYGFSNRLRFRPNRTFVSGSGSFGSSVYINFDN
ncbi:MAG: hypothetical protein AAFQ37_07380, partial [Bacteroidota bacterium]